MKGVKEVVKVGDNAVAVVADTWWPPRPRSTRCRSSGTKAPTRRSPAPRSPTWLKEGLDAAQPPSSATRAATQGRARRRRQEGRGGLRLSLSEPRDHGADERDRALDAGQVRGVVLDAERRGGACRRRRRPPACRRRNAKSTRLPGRWLRPARQFARLRAPGGADRQADARHADEADLVARRGYAARQIPPDHPVHDCCAASTRQQFDGAPLSGFRASRSSPAVAPGAHAGRQGSGDFLRASMPGGRGRDTAIDPQHPGRSFDAQPAYPPGFWRGVNINHNAIYIECFMDELAKETGWMRLSSGAS